MTGHRILVVEDHALVREAVTQALIQSGYDCLPASSGQEALAIVAAQAPIALAMLDLALPDMSGFSLLSVLAHRYPEMRILVVSGMADDASIKRAQSAGAAGFVSKAVSTEKMLEAVEKVLRGETVLPEPETVNAPRAARRRSVDSVAAQYGLTNAQTRVMELMVEGRTNREIAELLGVTEGTVKLHCSAILRALDVPNRAQALVVLGRQGLRA